MTRNNKFWVIFLDLFFSFTNEMLKPFFSISANYFQNHIDCSRFTVEKPFIFN